MFWFRNKKNNFQIHSYLEAWLLLQNSPPLNLIYCRFWDGFGRNLDIRDISIGKPQHSLKAWYSKCSRIFKNWLPTKNAYTNSADPDQTWKTDQTTSSEAV